MKLLLHLFMLQIILLSSTLVTAEDSVVASFQHCNKFTSADDAIGHLSRDIIEEVGRRLNASIKHVKAPVKRCLSMLKTGEVDFMFATQITADRSIYADFIHPSGGDKVVFLIRKEDGSWLNDYSDLKNKTLGVINGYNYFPKLNRDTSLHKQIVMNPKQLPKILLARRVDSFVTYKARADKILLEFPDFAEASYSVNHIEMGFLAVSKESPLHHRLEELERVVLNMIDDGYYHKKMDEHIPGVKSQFSKSPNLN